MNITVLYGQTHKGNTYSITKRIIDQVATAEDTVTEFFFPKNYKGSFCRGCQVCFNVGEENCPDYDYVQPIVDAMLKSDLIVYASPTYCWGISGPLKAFLDHLGYRWMEQRPHESMFKKVGLAVSTSGGDIGSKKVVSQLVDNFNGIGISEVIEYPKGVRAGSWNQIPPPVKASVEADIPVVAEKVKAALGKPQVTEEVKNNFMANREMQQGNVWNKLARDHWEEAGWLADARPWGD